ncbi:MAG: hypothetical protein AB1483_00470 [Candidatus Zixiibacteriota bacterium]
MADEYDKKSMKEIEARNTLPQSSWDDFDQFVQDYKYCATLRHNKPYVSYIVLADMIKAGWRRSAEEIE